MATEQAGERQLFIYGTLREPNHPMHRFLRHHSQWLGRASISARLYELGDYPGAVLTPTSTEATGNRVWGDVVCLNDAAGLLQKLDDYEECTAAFAEPHEYRREITRASMDAGKTLDCWVYAYQHPVDESRRIASGDYLEHLKLANNPRR